MTSSSQGTPRGRRSLEMFAGGPGTFHQSYPTVVRAVCKGGPEGRERRPLPAAAALVIFIRT
jgi:hypothetical protein